MQPFGGCTRDGVKYALLGGITFFIDFLLHGLMSHSAPSHRASVPKHVFPCKEVPSGGLVDTVTFWGVLRAKPPIFGPDIANPIIKKIANSSETVRDREKVAKHHI